MLRDEFGMRGHCLDTCRDDALRVGQERAHLGDRTQVGKGMVAARANALPLHHLYPAQLAKQLIVLAEEAAVAAIQIDLVLQRGRHLHRAAVLPERRVVALRGLVVQDDKVTRAFVLDARLRVDLVDVGMIEVGTREQRHQPRDRRLDQVDIGGLDRLEKPGRQTQGDAVAVPDALAPARHEGDVPRFVQRLAVQVSHQDRSGVLLAHEAAGVDVAIADAMLQRDAPLPAGAVRGGARHRDQRLHGAAGDRDRAVTGQPVRPILVAGVQGLLDEQALHARAVDEKITFDAAAIAQHDGADESIRLALLHGDDFAFNAFDALSLGQLAQESGIQSGVEVVGVRDFAQRRARHVRPWPHELGASRGRGVDGVVAEACDQAGMHTAQPEMMERQSIQVGPELAETVGVAVADRAPVHELDAELERAARGAQELVFVDAQNAIEGDDVRDRRLADTDDADLVGFHQPNRTRAPEVVGKRGGRHPTRSATAHDDDVTDQRTRHASTPRDDTSELVRRAQHDHTSIVVVLPGQQARGDLAANFWRLPCDCDLIGEVVPLQQQRETLERCPS